MDCILARIVASCSRIWWQGSQPILMFGERLWEAKPNLWAHRCFLLALSKLIISAIRADRVSGRFELSIHFRSYAVDGLCGIVLR